MIRLAKKTDLDKIMICINDAKRLLKDSGSKQWNGCNGYPNEINMIDDINNNCLYVYEINDDIASICAIKGHESDYDNPYGKWLTNTTNYITIHRICVCDKYRGIGISKELINFAFNFAKKNNCLSVRIDTHPKNIIMQNLLYKMGFIKCGYINLKNTIEEPMRYIYEKLI